MDNIILSRRWVQGTPVTIDNLTGTAFTGEAQAHTFRISGVDAAGADVQITGTITGAFLAPNNTTIPLTGTLTDGVAEVTMTSQCYELPGRFILSVYAANGDTNLCIYCGVGYVFCTETDQVAYPSAAIPDISQLIQEAQDVIDSIPEDYSALSAHFPATGKFVVGTNTSATEENAVAEGEDTIASGLSSHAEGYSSEASGDYSHSEGGSVASGGYSHAEGSASEASGDNAHAEGYETTASSDNSHSEGWGTTASGMNAHAEGVDTVASGNQSHAEGEGTIANHAAQSVFGTYNVADPSQAAATAKGNYAEIVGNGTADNARSNARTLDWSGNEALSGDLTINKNGANEMTVGEELSDLKSINTYNLLKDLTAASSGTVYEVTYTNNGNGTWTVTTSSAASNTVAKTIYGSSSSIPTGFTPGKTYYIKYSGINVGLALVATKDGTQLSNDIIYSDAVYRLDPTATGFELKLRVAKDSTANETVEPVVLSADTNYGLSELVHNPVYNSNFMHSIINCAKSYMVASDTGFFTYGSQSALDYNAEAPRQIHCGALSALIDGGCSFYDSRYVDPSGENRLYTSGYGFDFYAYSLKLALAGDADEIAYIGENNLTKTVDELKRLELFKSSAQLCAALTRWGMLFDVTSGTSINNNVLKPGDIIFYGKTTGSSQTDIVNGYHITHCDCVIGYKNGIPWVIDGGSVPITLHQAVYNSGFDYRIGGRVPLGLEL